MTIQEMRVLCDEIKDGIREANDRQDFNRVQYLQRKRREIKAVIQQCKSGSQLTPISATQN
jgi:uncharacterized membrane protein (DUF106 family)